MCGSSSFSVHRDHITIGFASIVIGVLWAEKVILEPFWCAGQERKRKVLDSVVHELVPS